METEELMGGGGGGQAYRIDCANKVCGKAEAVNKVYIYIMAAIGGI